MEKKLILVTSPPACGKTYVAKALAKNLKHIVYLDKDTLIVLSKQIFKVAGQESQSSRDSSKMATQRFIEASNSSSLLFWNKIRLSLCCGSARFSGMAKLHRRRYSSQ